MEELLGMVELLAMIVNAMDDGRWREDEHDERRKAKGMMMMVI